MTKLRLILPILAALTLSGFTVESSTSYIVPTGQPVGERKAQDALPKAKDALWDTLYKTIIHIDHKTSLYTATFPDEVKKLNGQTVTISGFMLPLESSEKFTHFLLSKRTPTCFFCPPGEPNEIIDVYAAKPTEWLDNLVTYQGKFELVNDQDAGIFFKMSNAVYMK